ncbi:hypothetical protein CFB84_10470 [Burkholderia aenigmatica]|uniref:Uncharacterized protein n=1 Tax=Burkholderia aenigmatica TaxID=2015348 RepID=A0A228J3Q5_9BURK|nr:hypothetical protein CFB84_10470 [Burkholderia aenigmatica]
MAHVLSIVQRDLGIVIEIARRAPSVFDEPVHAAIRQALINLAVDVVKQGARTRWSPIHATSGEVREVARGILRRSGK